ncbi:type II restriction endonuclease [Proteinivorax hydrogeniformans]|uniref:Type II restriction endonuclease n=1 Tax=Proteinivorax hydrogeniformans TaxID=1826727 RepID=A0AAU8HUZ8_9FIRM
MSAILDKAIDACRNNSLAFCKFVSANDVGATGTHQAGIYIPKNSYEILFDRPGVKGENKDKYVKIRWQDDFETDSRFIWYGRGTRSEYRVTRFGKGFPFLQDEYLGDLFVLVKVGHEFYTGFVISGDEEIESFLSAFSMSPSDTNALIKRKSIQTLEEIFLNYLGNLQSDFPTTYELAKAAREIYIKIKQGKKLSSADKTIIQWLDIEYQLFKAIENDRYKDIISKPFESVDELIRCANTMLNRRKSRAGRSLEHHLEALFNCYRISYSAQARTEGNKKPDFIFPSEEAYHNLSFPQEHLTFLGAKTTCKDRWRQILNEADRIENKHLLTLQQGISKNQLMEMEQNKVTLVVPKDYISSFPSEFRTKILTIEVFLKMLMERKR